VHGARLSVQHAVPAYIGRDPEGRLLYATSPQAVGPRRLQVTLLAVDPSSGETEVSDCWAGLPGPEWLLEHRFLLLDGKPMLLAETMRSDHLSLFGEKLVRLFALEADRSRLGLTPTFAVKSRMNLWQTSEPQMLDINGDGREDLVLGYWKGLMSKRVALDVYVREENGSFRDAPRSTAFDAKDGDTSLLLFGEDVSGDGLPDLMVRNDETWLLYRGLPTKNGKKLVDRKAVVLPLARREKFSANVEVALSAAGVSHFTMVGQSKPLVLPLAPGGGNALLAAWPGAGMSRGPATLPGSSTPSARRRCPAPPTGPTRYRRRRSRDDGQSPARPAEEE
jgi:hypothetical protein